ncbi:MAG: hypothetical protein ACKOKB_03125, partial [Bacteroidota bacterium]
ERNRANKKCKERSACSVLGFDASHLGNTGKQCEARFTVIQNETQLSQACLGEIEQIKNARHEVPALGWTLMPPT